MASVTAIETTKNQTVGMGQVAIAGGSACLTAVLGSCIGVALYGKESRLGVLAHVVLPNSSGHSRTANPGKFADTAIPHMLELLKRRGLDSGGLTAKLVGGACMFGATGPMQIGQDNVEALSRLLQEAGVRIVRRDVGGSNGRRISFDCGTGSVTVETVGKSPRII